MSAGPGKCVVLVPVARSCEPETEAGLRVLQERGYAVRLLRGGSQVDLVRSALASQALHDGFEETMWIDSDMEFNPDDVERLREHGLPMVAGLYVKKERDEFAGKFLPGTAGVSFGEGGGLLEMEYVGMGFTHIRAKVFREVARKRGLPACGGGYDPSRLVTPYFLPMVVPDASGGHCYLSEDYSLCHRARYAGFKVMADTTIRLGHMHRKARTWDDLAPRQTYAGLRLKIEGAHGS